MSPTVGYTVVCAEVTEEFLRELELYEIQWQKKVMMHGERKFLGSVSSGRF